MKYIIIIFVALTVGCQNTKTDAKIKSEDKFIDIDLIKKHLKLQERIELSENDTDISHLYHLTDKDIEIGGEAVFQGMKNNGYKTPDKDDFDKKVKEIFETSFDCRFTGE